MQSIVMHNPSDILLFFEWERHDGIGQIKTRSQEGH